MIYDRSTENCYFSRTFRDSNSARERIAMGGVVALEVARCQDPALLKSLKLYREYVERELFDERTMAVFDGACQDNKSIRAYNYPWMAAFYLEYFRATGENACLKNAARIMIAYYHLIETQPQESPCVETLRIILEMKKEGMLKIANELKSAMLGHADQILHRGSSMHSDEVSFTQAQFHIKIITLCQAFRLSRDEKYLKPIPEFLSCTRAFAAQQPDFHCNHQAVRYWDLFWFDKMKSYGDTMPQWVGAHCGEMYMQLGELMNNTELFEQGEAIIKNSLCVYDYTGFGSAGYLVPYRVSTYYSASGRRERYILEGTKYGKRYDDWANDQDWILY